MANFDVSQFLDSQNLELRGASSPGVYKVADTDGREGEFNAHQYLEAKAGLKPSQVSLQANTPDAPVDISPASFTDRAKLALGNAKGQVDYLKNKYEDATFNTDQDLVVKDKGVWHRVDAKFLGNGNGWDTTKEFMGDVADLADVALQTGAQAGAAAATGGSSALIGGAVAGAAKAVQTSLGRIVGTYQATPEEQLKDAALDAVLTAGGTKVLNGVANSVWPAITKAFSNLAEKAAPQVKESIASLLSTTSGTKDFNILRAMNRTAPVNQELAANIKAAGPKATFDSIEAAAKDRSVQATTSILSDAQKALSRQYVQKVDGFVTSVAPSIKTKGVPEAFDSFLGGLASAGIATPQVGSSGKLLGYTAASPVKMAKDFAATGMDVHTAKVISRDVQNFISSIQNLKASSTTLSGGNAVKQMLGLKRSLNEFYYNIVDGNPAMEKLLTPYTSQMKNSILNSFADDTANGVGNIAHVIGGVKGIDDFYSAMKPKVLQANRILDAQRKGNPEGLEAFVNKLYSDPASHMNAKDLITSIAGLKGAPAKPLVDRVFDNVAATDFVRLAPKGSGVNGSIIQGLRTGAVLGATAVAGPIAGAVTAGSMSPRAALSAIKATKAVANGFGLLKNNLSKTSVDERFKLLANPQVFGDMMKQVVDLGNNEQEADGMVQQALGK